MIFHDLVFNMDISFKITKIIKKREGNTLQLKKNNSYTKFNLDNLKLSFLVDFMKVKYHLLIYTLGFYSEGCPHGRGTIKYTDGEIYEGDWFEGCASGKGTMKYPKGDVYDGDWFEGN